MQKKVSNVSDNCGHQHVKKKRGKNVSFLLLTSYKIRLGVLPRD